MHRGPKSLRERISTKAALDKAWAFVRQGNETSCGPDGVTLEEFSRNWPQHRSRISASIRNHSYKMGGYLGCPIPKSGTSNRVFRTISIANISDRVVQRSILNCIWTKIRDSVFTDTSFGGIRKYHVRRRRGGTSSFLEDNVKTVKATAQRIVDLRKQGLVCVFETDIENFFPSINRSKLTASLASEFEDDSIEDMIVGALDTSVSNAQQLGPLASLWNADQGIPQGSALSPIFANYYLSSFDENVKKQGYKMVRYVDDLVIMCETETEANSAYHVCKNELNALGLTIPLLGEDCNGRVKTNIVSPGMSFDFLGLTFSANKIRPAKVKFSTLRNKIDLLTHPRKSKHRLHELIVRINWCLEGWIKAYSSICNLTKGDLSDLDRYVARRIRHWMKCRGIIRNPNQLTCEAYAWLGITRLEKQYINPILKLSQ